MKLDAGAYAALIAGAAALVAELMYLGHVRPLQADLGIQVSGLLLVVWATLVLILLVRKGWNACWVVAVTSPALIGPALFVWMIIGCAVFSACP